MSYVDSLAAGAHLERPFLTATVEGDSKGRGECQKARVDEGDSDSGIWIPQL